MSNTETRTPVTTLPFHGEVWVDLYRAGAAQLIQRLGEALAESTDERIGLSIRFADWSKENVYIEVRGRSGMSTGALIVDSAFTIR